MRRLAYLSLTVFLAIAALYSGEIYASPVWCGHCHEHCFYNCSSGGEYGPAEPTCYTACFNECQRGCTDEYQGSYPFPWYRPPG